eukprot:4661806-Amphidinium_carterae.1
MEPYMDHVRQLASELPEHWALIMRAEDRVRSEMFPRYKRELDRAALAGKIPVGVDYDQDAPWD